MANQRQPFNLPLKEGLTEKQRAEALKRAEQAQKFWQDREDDIDLDEVKTLNNQCMVVVTKSGKTTIEIQAPKTGPTIIESNPRPSELGEQHKAPPDQCIGVHGASKFQCTGLRDTPDQQSTELYGALVNQRSKPRDAPMEQRIEQCATPASQHSEGCNALKIPRLGVHAMDEGENSENAKEN
ncbi:hypothetical protein HAX54_017333 [Datura stramonium]|uniref:Uncharacterized protein n=1 Tax=Datura stramonium TaxID=4076 RepID=A0ABS8UKJ9_DATST|nr:hypothetical protein [Datura stramonium]